MVLILYDLSRKMRDNEACDIIDRIKVAGFETTQDAKKVLGHFSYDLFCTGVMPYWPKKSPFVRWFEDFGRKSHRNADFRIDKVTEEQYFKQLQASTPKEPGSPTGLERLRARRGLARVRPPAHAMEDEPVGPDNSSKQPALRSLKRKGLHVMPHSTPSKGKKAESTTGAGDKPKPKRIKFVKRWRETDSKQASRQQRKPQTALLRPVPQSSGPARDDAVEADDGYTSVDSLTGCPLVRTEWRLSQVKTPILATNEGVRQYWHVVDPRQPALIEHQVLGSLMPVKWSVLKDDFHLQISAVREVIFARGDTRIAILHKEGCDKRGDMMMAEFWTQATKRRFLGFLESRSIKVVKMGR
jgi:hypothetical protein